MTKSKTNNSDIDDNDNEMLAPEGGHEIESASAPINRDDPKLTDFGFSKDDLIKLLEAAAANNCVSFYRPINENAGGKIGLGTHLGKGISVKGKSSNFSPIAGEVPLDPRLSKLLEKEKPGKEQDYGLFYAQVLSQLGGNKEARIRRSAARVKNEERSRRFLDKYEHYKFCSAIEKTVGVLKVIDQEKNTLSYEISHKDNRNLESLYYFRQKNTDNSEMIDVSSLILTRQGKVKEPIFAIMVEGNLFFLNSENNAFVRDEKLEEAAANFERAKVEVLAYTKLRPKFRNGKIVFDPKQYVITADYDELASSGQKLMPLANNKSMYGVDQELLLKRESSEIALQILRFHEISKNQEFSSRQYYPELGAVAEIERNYKITQNLDTNASTSHGPEIGNPNPEAFNNEDAYPVIIPNLQIKDYVHKQLAAKFPEETGFNIGTFGAIKGFVLKLHGEEQIMFAFNLLRKIGYPLRTNPRWNWVVGKEEDSEFMIDMPDVEGKYLAGNKPKFRPLVKRERKIDWKKVADAIKKEKDDYDSAKDILTKEILGKFTEYLDLKLKDVRSSIKSKFKKSSNQKDFLENLDKFKEKEISRFEDRVVKLLALFEAEFMNYVVKFRDRMKDLSIRKLDGNDNTENVLKKILKISDDNDDWERKITIQKLVKKISRIAPDSLTVRKLSKFFKGFYSSKLNEALQNQMLMISELESAPSLTYSWGNFLSASASGMFKSDEKCVKLVKNLDKIDDMSKEDRERINRMLELGVQTGAAFEKWRKNGLEELKTGLDDGVEIFRKLVKNNTKLAEYTKLTSQNTDPKPVGPFTGKILDERKADNSKPQRKEKI